MRIQRNLRLGWASLAVLGVVCATTTAGAGTIDPGLQNVLASRDGDEIVSALVYLADQVSINALNDQFNQERAKLQQRHEVVVNSLRDKAQATQNELQEHLKALQVAGRIKEFHSFWITNAFRVDGPADEIRKLAEHPAVGTVYFNYPIELIAPVESAGGPPPAGREVTPGVEAVRAPEVWAMGFTGEGVLVANMDTGVEGDHPALESRWAGLLPQYEGHPEWAWYDPYAGMDEFPYDAGGHGTHTMGSICGGLPGDEIGVAPGAVWMASAPIDRGGGISGTVADAILSFEWMVDPDGDPGTYWDVPAVCSNSWGLTTGHGYSPCDELFWNYLDACEAAGTVILFSAGNEGSGGLRRPGDRATDDYRTCAVAAVDATSYSYPWPLASFSSTGPTYCTPDGGAAIKPDISAPGVDVWSSYPGGGYTSMSGTSMASPHLNGVVALVRQACPDLTGEEVKQVLYETAVDLGSEGEDNQFGWGMVDAYEAVNLALDMCGPSPPRVRDGYYQVPVDSSLTMTLQASDYDAGPEPITWQIASLPESGHTLTDAGNDHVITADELPYSLVDHGDQVVYTAADGFYGNDSFTFQATDGGEPPEGGVSDVATVSILVLFDPPTVATESLPDGCLGHSYGPVTLEADQGQPELTWGTVTDEYLEIDLGLSMYMGIGTAQDWHADDDYWSYDLPFTFPFFEQEYSTIYISSNGLIDFGGGSSDYSNSTEELIENTRIAVLWDDLRTDSGGDIYIFYGFGQVVVRWEGETYSGGDPVAFSAALFMNGTIRFHYGPGNTGLTPTIGVSAGDGTHYLVSSYDGSSSLTQAASLEFVQPVPLPEGIELGADGLLGGEPTETGTFEPRFTVTDALGRKDVKQLALLIEEECAFAIGDVNCDGAVNFFDIDAFVLAITDPAGYAAQYPDCSLSNADCNQDGEVNFFDIDAFVELIIE